MTHTFSYTTFDRFYDGFIIPVLMAKLDDLYTAGLYINILKSGLYPILGFVTLQYASEIDRDKYVGAKKPSSVMIFE